MNITQQIEEEKRKAKDTVELLEKENAEDAELLQNLNDQYKMTIMTAEDAELDELRNRIDQTDRRIARRKEKIRAMSAAINPKVEQLALERIDIFMKEIEDLQLEAAAKKKQLEPAREKFIEGLAELETMRQRINNLQTYVNQDTRHNLSDTAIKTAGLLKFDNFTSTANAAHQAIQALRIR